MDKLHEIADEQALLFYAGEVTIAEATVTIHAALDPEYCRENPQTSWQWARELFYEALDHIERGAEVGN